MDNTGVPELSREDLETINIRNRFKAELQLKPERFYPWFPFCRIRVLCVTDGNLDFSDLDFGLATFVRTLLDTRIPARFEVTLAHLNNRTGAAMMDFDSRIKDRIPNFKFDDTNDFVPDRYDVVFLFGIQTSQNGRGMASDGTPYPTDRLSDTELQAIAEFQNSGGGLFATGDHGALGRFVGRSLPRAGKMRLWDRTSANSDLDEVSMGGPRRNDTNRPGDPGSQFDDQSDDVPQQIIPRMYSVQNALFKYSFPHPLLCGPNGVIRVMPDHPHEGECVEPADTNDTLNFKSNLGPEYPPATSGGARPLPEVISTNTVLAGTTSGVKDSTIGHQFGGICAYDGHRASVGRCVTDATWHHFVNINLVGDADYPDNAVKGNGFLASTSGQAHLANIRAYYRNLAIWLSRPSNIRCINSGWITWLLRKGRVMEAVLTRTDLESSDLAIHNYWEIGKHARDVLGRYASRCQTRKLVLDLVWPEFEIPIPSIDPWVMDTRREAKVSERIGGGINWINGDHLLDAAFGAAIASVNDRFGDKYEERIDSDAVRKLAQKGARKGMEEALEVFNLSLENVMKQLKR